MVTSRESVMGTTPKYGLPFPAPTDLVRNGPQQFEDLADGVEDALGIVLVEDLGLSGDEFTIDVSEAAYQHVVIDDDCDVLLTGWPASGTGGYVVLEVEMSDPEFAVTWPAEIEWDGDDPPALGPDTRTRVVLFSRDAGTTVLGSYTAETDIS
jgi:hypothetical protein